MNEDVPATVLGLLGTAFAGKVERPDHQIYLLLCDVANSYNAVCLARSKLGNKVEVSRERSARCVGKRLFQDASYVDIGH